MSKNMDWDAMGYHNPMWRSWDTTFTSRGYRGGKTQEMDWRKKYAEMFGIPEDILYGRTKKEAPKDDGYVDKYPRWDARGSTQPTSVLTAEIIYPDGRRILKPVYLQVKKK